MNIIAVDDEIPALCVLENAIRQALPACSLEVFSTADDAIAHAEGVKTDVAFLDIEMDGMSGLFLARHLKEIFPKTNIVFVTGYSEFACYAMAMHASGYIMKPATSEQIAVEINNLRYPPEMPERRIMIKCFGSLCVSVDGEPLVFAHAKARELFALLVHKNGAALSNKEIAATLWEDRPYDRSLQSQTRRVRGQLSQILRQAGADDILIKSWNSLAVDTGMISCDYHEALSGNVAALNAYVGEYMNEYSWAEFTVEFLNSKVTMRL